MKIRFRNSDALKIVSGTNIDAPVSDPSVLFASNYLPSYTSAYTFYVTSSNAQAQFFTRPTFYWSRSVMPTIFIAYRCDDGSIWQGDQYDYRVWGKVGPSTYGFVPITTYYAQFMIYKDHLEFEIQSPSTSNITVKIWVLEN